MKEICHSKWVKLQNQTFSMHPKPSPLRWSNPRTNLWSTKFGSHEQKKSQNKLSTRCWCLSLSKVALLLRQGSVSTWSSRHSYREHTKWKVLLRDIRQSNRNSIYGATKKVCRRGNSSISSSKRRLVSKIGFKISKRKVSKDYIMFL